eukprot:1161696-Pelagomonas_calceolata.AAC.31
MHPPWQLIGNSVLQPASCTLRLMPGEFLHAGHLLSPKVIATWAYKKCAYDLVRAKDYMLDFKGHCVGVKMIHAIPCLIKGIDTWHWCSDSLHNSYFCGPSPDLRLLTVPCKQDTSIQKLRKEGTGC